MGWLQPLLHPLRITTGTPTVCVTCVARRGSLWVHKQKTQRFKHRIITTCYKTLTQRVEVHIFLLRNFNTNLCPTPTAPVWSVWQFQLCSRLPCVVIVQLYLLQSAEWYFLRSHRLHEQSRPITESFICLTEASNGRWFLRVAILARSGAASETAALLQNMPSLSWMEETKEIKTNNYVLSKRLAEPACLAALWSAAACVSGIVLEAGVQKQQGAEDKQAVRDSLNTATVASTVEGCEDLCSNRPINPPYQLERASVRLTPHQRLAATRHIWDLGPSSLQTPQTYIRALMDSYGTIGSTSRFKTRKMSFREEEGRTRCHSSTAQVIPSLYYEQHMSWSVSRGWMSQQRERTSSYQSHPPQQLNMKQYFQTIFLPVFHYLRRVPSLLSFYEPSISFPVA